MKVESGSEGGNYWKGLENIYLLTQSNQFKLQVTFVSRANDAEYLAEYSTFQVSNEASGYQLSIGGFEGAFTEDAFQDYNGYKFTTRDRKNDNAAPETNCASELQGGWWYDTCDCDACLSQGSADKFSWTVGFMEFPLKAVSMTIVCK